MFKRTILATGVLSVALGATLATAPAANATFIPRGCLDKSHIIAANPDGSQTGWRNSGRKDSKGCPIWVKYRVK